ncbi:glutathione S-transferase class-mu 26 kDa isozyme 47 [Folsomia candida]|uniref:glutathione transferase n=1 Tax=Folsomia candida TaxID=158441 RepID=A0A226EAE1_FOLCA|nr:glutathione S-transferase class-mu 26 kDa isozyme 47 [Folsomia candida]OXA53606.1 Glutathione S-transferase Mu 1 [Folsomia candida]
MGKPQFGYWDLRGLGHATRFALAYMGVDYEHVVYIENNEEAGGEKTWAHQKPKLGMDAPNLPYWFDDKVKLTESLAILKYVVRKYKPALMPTDLVQLSKVEQTEGVIADTYSYIFAAAYSGTDKEKERFESETPKKVEILSKCLGDKKFLLGNEMCYLDFVLFEQFSMLTKYRPDLVPKNLQAFVSNLEKIPEIATYISSPTFISSPFFGRTSLAQV